MDIVKYEYEILGFTQLFLKMHKIDRILSFIGIRICKELQSKSEMTLNYRYTMLPLDAKVIPE